MADAGDSRKSGIPRCSRIGFDVHRSTSIKFDFVLKLLFGPYKFDRDRPAGNWHLKVEGAIHRSLRGLPRTVDDQAITSSGETCESKRDRVGKGGMVFKREAQVCKAVVVGDRLPRRESIAIEEQVHALAAGKDVEAFAQTVVRHDLGAAAVLRDGAAVSIASEDGIVDDDSGCVAESSAKAEFNLARVPPWASAHLLIPQPGTSPGSRFEAATCSPVVVLTGIPVAVVGLGSARVDQGKRAEIGGEAEAKVLRWIG